MSFYISFNIAVWFTCLIMNLSVFGKVLFYKEDVSLKLMMFWAAPTTYILFINFPSIFGT